MVVRLPLLSAMGEGVVKRKIVIYGNVGMDPHLRFNVGIHPHPCFVWG